MTDLLNWVAEQIRFLEKEDSEERMVSGVCYMGIAKSASAPGPSIARGRLGPPTPSWKVWTELQNRAENCPPKVRDDFFREFPDQRVNKVRDLRLALRWLHERLLSTSTPFATLQVPNADGQSCKADSTNKPKTLRPCDRKALSQYEHAMEQQPTLKTDDEAYDWLADDAEADDAPLPRRDHWKRYLRKARASCDHQKNGPRIGNETRSVVSAKRLDNAKRTKTDQR